MKRVFIVHRWEGSPRSDWYPWLKRTLEEKGFQVMVPKMPDTRRPKIRSWVDALKKQVRVVDQDTYFIGHSIGCQTIIRYLGSQSKKCGGCIFVGGWFALTSQATPTLEYERLAAPWLLTPIDFSRAKKNIGGAIAILSTNDPYVPILNKEVFVKTLGVKVKMVNDYGHFTKEEGITSLPFIIKEIKRIAG